MILEEFDAAVESERIKVARKVVKFFGELKDAAPVDTGVFKGAYELIEHGKMQWTIYNPMEYASILAGGRRPRGGKWYGSEQWPEGIFPMLGKFREELR